MLLITNSFAVPSRDAELLFMDIVKMYLQLTATICINDRGIQQSISNICPRKGHCNDRIWTLRVSKMHAMAGP